MSHGANIIDFSKENGYGTPSDKPFSNGQATYTSSPALTPINLSGKENFSDNTRFTGDKGGQPRVEASGIGQKDSIETGGGA